MLRRLITLDKFARSLSRAIKEMLDRKPRAGVRVSGEQLLARVQVDDGRDVVAAVVDRVDDDFEVQRLAAAGLLRVLRVLAMVGVVEEEVRVCC